MNKQRLIQLRNFIATHEEAFNYNYVLKWDGSVVNRTPEGPLTEESFKNLQHTCGTAGCIAGWAAALFSSSADYYHKDPYELAADELSLTREDLFDTDWLFEPWGEVTDNDEDLEVGRFFEHASKEDQLAEALARLDWLIDGKNPHDYESQVVKDYWHTKEDISC